MANPTAPSVVYRLDTSQLKALSAAMGDLAQGEAFSALRRAINTVGRRAYTRIIRNLAKETSAQQKRIRLLIRPVPAYSTLEWKAVAKAQYFSLKDFRPRQQAGGVKHSAWGGGFIAHAFVNDSLGGHVYFREGSPRTMTRGRYKGQRRQPIKKLWGPNIAVQLSRGGTKAVLTELAGAELVPEALRQLGLKIHEVGESRIERAKQIGEFVDRFI